MQQQDETGFRPDDNTSPSPGRRKSDVARPHYTPVLICLEGKQRGYRFPLHKSENIIGRGLAAEIRIEDDMASRRHAKVTYNNWSDPRQTPECFVEDLGSRNGTELNGQLVDRPESLHERDRILIGSTILGFFLRDERELQMDESLFKLATRDALTGLDNRHQFREHMTHHIERARRYGSNISLLVVDADHFKNINDTYGHDIGDKVLIHVANLLKGCCRASELCARWGGEEFVVLLPDTDARAAGIVAERIRRSIQSNPLVISSRIIETSVSIGGCQYEPKDNEDSFFRRADQELLKAKELGRNRCSVFGAAVPS